MVHLDQVYDPNGANLQFYLHQMSLDSVLASYLKRNEISSWMLSQYVSSETKHNLTTSGLNDIFIQLLPPVPPSAPAPALPAHGKTN